MTDPDDRREVPPDEPEPVPRGRLVELARLFLRLGLTSFGGPAAHTAMMHHDVVRRRQWLTDDGFVDLVGATNLIPGPNSTELAMYLGWIRGRGRGLVVAGACFILPAAVLVGVLAWAYVEYGQAPAFERILYGVKPVVIALIALAVVRLVPAAARSPLLAALVLGGLVAFLVGVFELVVLAVAGGVAAGAHAVRARRTDRLDIWLPVGIAAPGAEVELWRVFLVFLQIGAVLYGSGYVLLAFLEGELVDRLGWLTSEQLLDAVAIGQATPGPLFTTATFVGYVVAGFWGAVLATVGIFLPSFVLVAALTRLVSWLRSSAVLGAALDGVNAAAVGLVAGAGVRLAGDAFVDPVTVGVAIVAALLLWRTRINSAWLVGGGAAAGLVSAWLG